MKYIKPYIRIEEAQAAQMLAESLKVSDETVGGGDALVGEDKSWNIWGEE